jgi:hypothetical protein
MSCVILNVILLSVIILGVIMALCHYTEDHDECYSALGYYVESYTKRYYLSIIMLC